MTNTNGRAALVRAIALALLTLILAFGGVVAGRRLIATHERETAHALVSAARDALSNGDRAAGVVMLERARVLAPRDGEIRDAIASARIDDPRSVIDRAFGYVSPAEWLAVGTVSAWIAGAALVYVGIGRPRRALRVVGAASAALLVVSTCGVQRWRSSETAVVSAAGASALVAPFDGARPSSPVQAGTVVVRGTTHGHFIRVQNRDAAIEGWVPSSALVPVTRRTS